MLGIGNGLVYGGHIGFEPTEIADISFWFDATHGTTLDTDLVDSWAAKFGPWCAKSPSGGATRPTHNDTYITFDGGDDLDIYRSDCSTALDITLDSGSGGWTLLAIYTDADWNGAQQAIFGHKSANTDFVRHDLTNDRFEIKINNNLRTIDLDSALTDSQYYAIMLTFDGTLTLYIDNVAQADTETLSDSNDITINAFAQRNNVDKLTGDVKHLIGYDRILTSGERAQIQSWANQFIG
jgi:hypothetical protein